MSVFCRHNRFLADCPICSKGTVLDSSRPRRRSSTGAGGKRKAAKAESPAFSGPHVATPVYEDEEGVRLLVRLERVPGGVRLGEWAGSSLRKCAPVLSVEDLVDLIARSGEALAARDAALLTEALAAEPSGATDSATAGVSRGRTGDYKEELRVEALEDGRVRVARWVLRPVGGWELQDAPPMLPAERYAKALADAGRKGLLAGAPSDAPDPVRP